LGALRDGFTFEGRVGVRPSPADVLRAYLEGSVVVGACGVSGCEGLDLGVWSSGFCSVCGVFGG
jgi:hypothetical protein